MNPLPTKSNRWRTITVFNLLVGLLFSFSALAQPASLKEGLVAYFPFDGGGNNEAAGSSMGSFVTKSFVSLTDRFGGIGKAMDLITEGEELTKIGADSSGATISFWYQSTTFADSVLNWPKFNGSYTRPFGRVFGLNMMSYPDGMLLIGSTANAQMNAFYLEPIKTWQHICIVMNGSLKKTIVFQNGKK